LIRPGAKQDAVSELRRIPLLGTWVNRILCIEDSSWGAMVAAERAEDRNREEQSTEMWSSLEIVKLGVSAVTPFVVIAVGYWINLHLNELEKSQLANQRVVEKRLEVFDVIAPLLNDLICYFTYIGDWKKLSPPKVLERKRTLDKKVYVNAPLFSEQFLERYKEFIGVCFETYTGWGEDAKLRTETEHRREVAQAGWKPEWDKYFTAADQVIAMREVKKKYDELMTTFARELSVDLVVEGLERITYSGRGPKNTN
jgi:hypothetical protein